MRGNRKSLPDMTFAPPDNVCQLLGEHLSEGLNFSSFAGVLGISRVTLNALLDRTPELKTVKDIGECKAMLFYEKIRRNALMGIPSEVIDPKTKEIRQFTPHVGMLMFTLHTRFPVEYPRENEAVPIDQYEFASEVAEQIHLLQSE
jgi:hypothetical protein